MPTPLEFTNAIETQYAKTHSKALAYLVIAEDSTILRWSNGMAKLFGASQRQVMEPDESGEKFRFGALLPEEMSEHMRKRFPGLNADEIHAELIRLEYQLMRDGFASGEGYAGRRMGGGTSGVVEGRKVDGTPTKFAIELFALKMVDEYYLLGFLTKSIEEAAAELNAVATEERDEKNKQLKFAEAGVGFGFKWIGKAFISVQDNVWSGVPKAFRGPLTLLTLLGLSYAGLLGYERYRDITRPVKPPLQQDNDFTWPTSPTSSSSPR